MQIDTFAFRFSKHNDPLARKIIYLVQGDFHTPQDAFYEGDVPHWEKDEWRKATWGVVAGPMDLCLAPEAYGYYAGLAEACKEDFMSVVIHRQAEALLKK